MKRLMIAVLAMFGVAACSHPDDFDRATGAEVRGTFVLEEESELRPQAPRTTESVLSDADIQIISFDAVFPDYRDSLCLPESAYFSDQQIIDLIEEGLGERLEPEAARHIVNKIRECSR
jgi:hypothetical protein